MRYISEDYLLKLMEDPEQYNFIGSRDIADAPGVEMITCDECVFKRVSGGDPYCRNPLTSGLEFDVIYGAEMPCMHGIKRKVEIPEVTKEAEDEEFFG